MDKKDPINPKIEPTEPKTEPTEPANIPTAAETSSSQPTDTDVTPKPPQLTLPTTSSTSTPANAPPKRTFMPNIGVQRVKKEVKEEDSKPQSTRKPPQPNLSRSSRGGRGGARGANNNSNVIQSHSIFEGGPGMSTKRFGGDRETYESTTRISGSVLSGVSVKREGGGGAGESSSRSIKVEETILIEDQKENDDQEIYVSLKCEAKDEPVVENLDLDGDDDLSGTNSQDNAKLRDILDPQDPEEKMKDRLVLFQIPETLNLTEMPEGHIGKLRIYESGKVEMVINDDKVFDVSLSVSGSFLQDAAAFEQIDEENAELTQLGHILSKLVVSQQI